MVFPYSCKAYFNDLKFGDLIGNQNHYIHIIGSWITPRPHVLFEISKDIFNFNLPTFGRSSAATRQQIIAKIISGRELLQDLLAHK